MANRPKIGVFGEVGCGGKTALFCIAMFSLAASYDLY
jgi:hypothetical protein